MPCQIKTAHSKIILVPEMRQITYKSNESPPEREPVK